jgi:hypothetical protein
MLGRGRVICVLAVPPLTEVLRPATNAGLSPLAWSVGARGLAMLASATRTAHARVSRESIAGYFESTLQCTQ